VTPNEHLELAGGGGPAQVRPGLLFFYLLPCIILYMTTLVGTVEEGYHAAGNNLRRVLPLIESRSGLRSLLPHTLNLKLKEPYLVVPDFIVTREEYNHNNEEILFQRCSVKRLPCLIMRTATNAASFTARRTWSS
jgi:hypothetical protein